MTLNTQTVQLDNLLRTINTLLGKYTKKKLVKYDLTLPRFHTLWMISKLEPVNMGQLKEKMMVANSTLTVTVDHLVTEGFVERYRDENDRRVVLLKITVKGEEQLQALLAERQRFFQEGLKRINLEEQNQLIDSLETILKNLRELTDNTY